MSTLFSNSKEDKELQRQAKYKPTDIGEARKLAEAAKLEKQKAADRQAKLRQAADEAGYMPDPGDIIN